MEGDGRALLTKDDPPRCSWWRQVCWLKDDCLNGGPSLLLRAASARKRRMLLEEQTMAEVKIPSAAVGYESAMAAGAENNVAVEAGDGCVLV